MTPLRLTGQTVRQRTCTIRINERRAAQVFRAPGDSVSAEVGSDIELEIQPYDGDGLSFSSHDLRTPQNIKFDGHDHPNAGPDVPSGSASSGRRMNRRGVEITNKIRGKITDTRQIEVSTDQKTLTMSIRQAGERKPKNILVFDRE